MSTTTKAPARTAADPTKDTTALWSDLGGMIACSSHLGGYGTAELRARPRARRLETYITVWSKQTRADRQDFLEQVGEEMKCESCR